MMEEKGKEKTVEKEMKAYQLREIDSKIISQDDLQSSKDGGKAAGKRKLHHEDNKDVDKKFNRDEIAEKLEGLRRMVKETPTARGVIELQMLEWRLQFDGDDDAIKKYIDGKSSSQDDSESSKDEEKAAREVERKLKREQIAEKLQGLRRMAKEAPTREIINEIADLNLSEWRLQFEEEDIAVNKYTEGVFELAKILTVENLETILDERGCFTAESEKKFEAAGLLGEAKRFKETRELFKKSMEKKRTPCSLNPMSYERRREVEAVFKTMSDVIKSHIEPGKTLFDRGVAIPRSAFEEKGIPKGFIDMVDNDIVAQHLFGRRIF